MILEVVELILFFLPAWQSFKFACWNSNSWRFRSGRAPLYFDHWLQLQVTL